MRVGGYLCKRKVDVLHWKQKRKFVLEWDFVAIDNQFVNLEDTAGAVIEFLEGLSYFSVCVDYLKWEYIVSVITQVNF